MDQDPYEAPHPTEDRLAGTPWPLQTPTTWWFWLALLLLVIAVMIANQVGVMQARHGSKSTTPMAAP